jgi:hypothetical protein
MEDDKRPKGIGFFNIKTGETRYAQLEPQVQAYINSSDIGINASRGQDFKWRLTEEWVKRVRAFRKNELKMSLLTDKNGGRTPTTTQILYAIYGEQIRAAQERAEENENPYEEEYLQRISSKPEQVVAPTQPNVEEPAPEEDLPKPKVPAKSK